MKNKTVVEHIIYESFGKGDLSKYDQTIADNVKIHCPLSWQQFFSLNMKGKKNVKLVDQEFASAFQFKTMTIEDLLIDKNKILARWSCNGIHKDTFFSINPTRQTFQLTGQTIYQFSHDHKVEEVWQSWDMLGLLQQIQPPTSFPPSKNKSINNSLKKAWSSLSEKERECIKYLIEGKTARETAAHMHLSPRTVEYYFENIKNKINCYKKRDLFKIAREMEEHNFIT